MGFILVGRKKGSSDKFEDLGPYDFEGAKDFGELKVLQRNNPLYELKIIEVRT